MIMKYIGMPFEKQAGELEEKFKQNSTYVAAEKDWLECVSKLDEAIISEVDSKSSYVEAIARDIAYDEGFKEGVRFTMGCMSKGEVMQYE